VGIDLGGEHHQVHIINPAGESLAERLVPHTGAGISEFLDWLAQLTGPDPASVAVAVENPRGAVIEALLERGYAVYSINPKQLDRFRDRFSVAGAKDDSRDGCVLAHSLRTDLPCFRRQRVEHAKILLLRELSRTHDQIVEDLRRAANQLNDSIRRYFPGLLALCAGTDEPWLWHLLQLAPLPAPAARLSKQRLATLLKQHRIRRFSSDDLCAVLQARALPMAPGSAEAIAEQVILLLPRLTQLHQQRGQLEQRIEKLLEELASDESYSGHRDVTILRSMPGVGRGFTAAVLSEAPTALADRDYRALRSLAGSAPVTKQSGKSRSVIMRHACNGRLRTALHHSTGVHIQQDARARQQYADLRQHGHSHGRAIRGVGDRMLARLIAMLKQHTPYDPARRQALCQDQ
jgi:transposase